MSAERGEGASWGEGGGEQGRGSRDLCVERVAAREQREAARPIIDWALLGEHGSEFSRHFQHISLPFQAARRSATQSPRPSKEK